MVSKVEPLNQACSIHLSQIKINVFLKTFCLTLIPFKTFEFLLVCVLLIVGVSLI